MEYNENIVVNIKSLFRRSMNRCYKEWKSNPPYYTFIIFMLFSMIFLYFCVADSKGDVFDKILFYNPNDPFADMYMDLFNPLGASYMDNPYTQINAMYPPINFLLMRLFFIGVPESRLNTKLSSYNVDYDLLLYARNSRSCIISYTIYVMIFVIIILYIINAYLKKNNLKLIWLFDILIVLSQGFLYTIDRGNFLLPTIACILFFFYTEGSDNKVLKEIGLFSLAIAICMKIYPVVYAMYILSKKGIKEIWRLIVYCCVLFFIPFAFYGGIDAIKHIAKNVFSVSDWLSSIYLGGSISISTQCELYRYLMGYAGENSLFEKILPLIVFFLCICFHLFLDSKGEKVLLLTLGMILYPASSMRYNLIYLITPTVLLFTEKGNKMILYYILLICGCFVSIPYIIREIPEFSNHLDGVPITYGTIINSLSLDILTCMLIFIAYENVSHKIKHYNKNLISE